MINRVVLMGRLTAAPELRQTPSGVSVASFSVAVDRRYTKDGERQTDFINIVAWRQTADFVCRYFRKGNMIALDGSIQTRNYTDKNGNKRTAFEVVADSVSFCGGKAKNDTPDRDTPSVEIPRVDQITQYSRKNVDATPPQQSYAGAFQEMDQLNFDGDLPF